MPRESAKRQIGLLSSSPETAFVTWALIHRGIPAVRARANTRYSFEHNIDQFD